MSAVSAREHHWDSLRAFLMLLGIPYHAAMVYNARVLWDIQSPERSEALTFLSGVLVTFRMPAFFIVAGYFAAMMLERRAPGAWLGGRFLRLGIPFLTGFVLLAPVQVVLIDLNAAFTSAVPLMAALHHAAKDVTQPSFSWIAHLWFLPALLAYSLLLAMLLPQARTAPLAAILRRAQSFCLTQKRLALLALVLVVAAWEVGLYLSHRSLLASEGSLPFLLAHGVDPYLRYLPFFFVGVALRSAPNLRSALVWQKGWALPAFGLATAILASLLRGRDTAALGIAHTAFDAAAAILLSLVLIGIAERFWNRPDPRVDRIVDAAFSIYLLHHPLIFALSTLFVLVGWPPVMEFLLVCLATLVLSYGIHRLIRRSPLALFLFNGVPMRRNPRDIDRPQSPVTTLR
ncbi:MAG: acyltransferase family protein [Rhizobium sp.]|nr:acyltransferase family protein [Rhizobium sp.]